MRKSTFEKLPLLFKDVAAKRHVVFYVGGDGMEHILGRQMGSVHYNDSHQGPEREDIGVKCARATASQYKEIGEAHA